MDFIESFVYQLQECYRGHTPTIRLASAMNNHAITLQKNRLVRYGYFLTYDIQKTPASHDFHFGGRGDAKYTIDNYQLPVVLTRTIYKNGTVINRGSEEKKLFIMVEDLKVKSPDESEIVNCPNCGAPDTIGSLRTGCKYCGTHFEMSDIYPCVNTYYFNEDYAVHGADVSTPTGRLKAYGKAYGKFFKLLSQVPQAGNQIAHGALSANKRYVEFMKQLRPDFSYEHFVDYAYAITRVLLFSDSPSSLPFVEIPNCPVLMPNLVDLEFTGVAIDKENSYGVNGNMAFVKVIFYVKGLLDVNGRLFEPKMKFRITLQRDITAPVDYGFSFTKIACKTCNGVFDAVRTRCCPYCNSEYQLQHEEWEIIQIEKID